MTLQGMKILTTGEAGMIGATLMVKLVHTRAMLTVADNPWCGRKDVIGMKATHRQGVDRVSSELPEGLRGSVCFPCG